MMHGGIAMTRLSDLKEKHSTDPAFREAYSMADLELNVAEELIKARLRAGMTQADMAEALGTQQPGIARIESGRLSLKTIKRYAEATGSRVIIKLEPAE
jgi:DNA-binding XRE family transcriptional regulator